MVGVQTWLLLAIIGYVQGNQHQHVIHKREVFVDDDKQDIIEQHNQLRRGLRASNMYHMVRL